MSLEDEVRDHLDLPLLTHFVIVAAGVNDEGEKLTRLITSDEMPLWQAHGLLSSEAAATTPQPYWSEECDE